MAAIAAHAAWHMGDWDSMAVYTGTLKEAADAPAARLSAEFLSGVLHAHNQDWAAVAGPPPPSSLSPAGGFCIMALYGDEWRWWGVVGGRLRESLRIAGVGKFLRNTEVSGPASPA